MDEHRSAPRSRMIPKPESSEIGSSRPLETVNALGLRGKAVKVWVGVQPPPEASSYVGEGQLWALEAGLRVDPAPGENLVKKGLKTAVDLAQVIGVIGLETVSTLGEMLLESVEEAERESSHKTKPSIFIPFVEIVQISFRRHQGQADLCGITRENLNGDRTDFWILGMGNEWLSLIMTARIERELDYLRTKVKADLLDIQSIQNVVVEKAKTTYGDWDWQPHKKELLEEAVEAANQQLEEKAFTSDTEATSILAHLSPMLPEYRLVPEFAVKIEALEVATRMREVIPVRVNREEASRLFSEIANAVEEGAVCGIVFSPEGHRALRCSGRFIRLWEVDTGHEIQCLIGSPETVWAVGFSPDGHRAISGGEDGICQVWDLESGLETRRLVGHTKSVRSVTFSPDGRRAISGGLDGVIYVWDVENGKQVRRLFGLPPIWSVAFSPDGRRALVGDGGHIGIFQVDGLRGGIFYFNRTPTGAVSVAFSPDGRRALSAGEDKTVHLWDVESKREIRRFEGHTHFVWSVVFSPDGHRALSASWDKTVRLWEIESGREIGCLGPVVDSSFNCVAFSPDGRRALAGGAGKKRVFLWELPR